MIHLATTPFHASDLSELADLADDLGLELTVTDRGATLGTSGDALNIDAHALAVCIAPLKTGSICVRIVETHVHDDQTSIMYVLTVWDQTKARYSVNGIAADGTFLCESRPTVLSPSCII
jgi:hypothetical protein